MSNLTMLNNVNYAQRVIESHAETSSLNHHVETIQTSRPVIKKTTKKTLNKKKRNALSNVEPNLLGMKKARSNNDDNTTNTDEDNFTNIVTNCPDIDELFHEGKGLRENDIVSIYGKAGLGKTQICHIFAANCLFNDSKSKVIWISCNNNSFRPSRIKEILQSKNLPNTEISKLLDQILFIDIQGKYKNGNTLDGVETFVKIAKNQANVKLLIVDSIGNAYKIHRNSKKNGTLPSTVSPKLAMNRVINTIKEYVQFKKTPVILTNDVVANMSGGSSSNYNNNKDDDGNGNGSGSSGISIYSASKFTSKPVINIERHCSLILRLTRRDGTSRRKMTLLSQNNDAMNEAMFDIVTTGLAGN